MAKKSAIQRNLNRLRLIEKYAAKRAELKAIIANPETSDEDFYKAQAKLTKLPKNDSYQYKYQYNIKYLMLITESK